MRSADLNNQFDALIVGAGPAGSALATWLARAGLSVALLDKATFPRDKPCGEYLSPEIQRIFAALGVSEKINQAEPMQLAGMRVWTAAGKGFQGDFSTDPASPIFGLALPRLALDQILIDHARAQGACVLEGFRVMQLQQVNDRVTGVTGQYLGQATALSGKLIVGADGLNSVVARRLTERRPHRWLRKVAFVTHYEGVTGLEPYGEMFVGAQRYCGLAPLGKSLGNVSVVVDAAQAQIWKADIETNFRREIERYPLLAAKLKHAQRVKPILAIGPLAITSPPAPTPGVILLGDAAYFLDPFTGEGMFTALHNAELAGRLVLECWQAEGPAPEFYRRYELERQQIFRPKWQVCAIVQWAIRYPWLMDLFVERLGRRKELADILVGVTGDFRSPREVLSAGYFTRLLR